MDFVGIGIVVALGCLLFGRVIYAIGYYHGRDEATRGQDLPYGITKG
jgi:hypothetical protein